MRAARRRHRARRPVQFRASSPPVRARATAAPPYFDYAPAPPRSSSLASRPSKRVVRAAFDVPAARRRAAVSRRAHPAVAVVLAGARSVRRSSTTIVAMRARIRFPHEFWVELRDADGAAAAADAAHAACPSPMTGFVDAHHHVWSLARGDYGWLTPDLAPIYRDFSLKDLAPLREQAGVDDHRARAGGADGGRDAVTCSTSRSAATAWSRAWSAGSTWPRPTPSRR